MDIQSSSSSNVHNESQSTYEASQDFAPIAIDMDVDPDLEEEDEDDDDVPLLPREKVIAGLEEIVQRLLDDMRHLLEAASVKSSRDARKPLVIKLLRRDGSRTYRTVSWPKGKYSTRTFARVVKVVEMCYGAVMSGIVITKRDIYYHDVALFGKQSVVDQLVDDLACTLECSRSDLNVTASPKGAMCGAEISILLSSGRTLQLNPTEAALVPPGEDIEQILTKKYKFGWVLVVEKEAVFQTLRASGLAASPWLSRCGLIITGKGQPDVNSRKLIANLDAILPPHIPILLLVDGDAYGLEIASVYKFGSMKMLHEAADLTCPRAQLIGLTSSDLSRFGVPMDSLLPITKADEKKTIAMLRRDPSVMPASWRSSLTYFLKLRRKAEIEILSSADFARFTAPLPPVSAPTAITSPAVDVALAASAIATPSALSLPALTPASFLDPTTSPECPPQAPQSHPDPPLAARAGPDDVQAQVRAAWNNLRTGSMLVPYLISTVSEHLPPLQWTDETISRIVAGGTGARAVPEDVTMGEADLGGTGYALVDEWDEDAIQML